MLGVDIVEEDNMDAVIAAMEKKKRRVRVSAGEEMETEDVEVAPTWEGDPSVVKEPVDTSTCT